MSEALEIMNSGEQIAPYLKAGAFDSYRTYSFINRSAFFAMIDAPYYDFMSRFVQNWLWWNDGYVPYFHDADKGIPSTRIGGAIVDRAARKVVGGRIMFKNAGEDSTKDGINPAMKAVGDWAQKVDFDRVVRLAVKYAAAAGTALIKLNKSEHGLWAEALRFDSFLPVIGAEGNVVAVDCYLRCFTNLGVMNIEEKEGSDLTAYYVIERRYFGEYTKADGTVLHNAPLCRYIVKRQNGSITQGGQYARAENGGTVLFKDLPKSIRKSIGSAYADILFDKPVLLPFDDYLGVEIIKWTDSVSALPEVPFGESLLSPIISHLMSWDYYHAAADTDMYLGRGRVLLPKYMQSATGGQYNNGLDSFLFTQIQQTDPDKQTPTPIQFAIRSSEWKEIRDRLIQDISINTGLNISTIASFISDSTAARTAREISTEENETAEFVNEKRAIVEKPINRIIWCFEKYMGLTDKVVIRWSGAGLTNRYALAEIISTARAGGFLSRYKAVQMFNFDDDTAQIEEEYERIKDEEEQNDMPDFNSSDYFGEMNDGYGTSGQPGGDAPAGSRQRGLSDGKEPSQNTERMP